MADYAFQTENLKAIADAIREKDGTNGAIMPLDFPDRIRAIYSASVGGLPEGGSLGQVLGKASSEDGDVRWQTVVNSFNGRAGFVFPQEGDYTADDVGAVPTYRSVNNKTLESDIWLTADDVDATSKNEFNQNITRIDGNITSIESQLTNRVATVESKIQTVESSVQGLITYGMSALSSGTSSLTTGTLYVQYE